MYKQAQIQKKFKNIIAVFEKSKDEFPQLFQNKKELSNLTASWFIGPKSENSALLMKALEMALESNKEFRELYHPEDPEYVSTAIKNTDEYKEDITAFFEEFQKMLQSLKVSTPFFSYRSLGHMNWEISIPAMAGYFAAMLYNQNNVALEASPATTAMERSVAADLCTMLGYKIDTNKPNDIQPWGHITTDGSIANIESVWASRNIKFYPLALQQLIKSNKTLSNAKKIKIEIKGKSKFFIKLSEWELLNVPESIALNLPNEILLLCKSITNEELNTALKPFLVQETGLLNIYQSILKKSNTPVVIGPASAHYSWAKACALTGIGAQNFIHVPLDKNARMDSNELDKILVHCLHKKTPVLEVVAVIGTTEEGAVDPLNDIVKLKEKYAKLGLNFHLHADAAWGGYFASLLVGEKIVNTNLPGFVPNLSLSDYTIQQFKALAEADTITIDPHKAGYVPYPAGALCYRHSGLKNLISFIPSYIDHGSNDPSMGLFGIEGSKPGAAAASIFLSHKVMPPNVNGIGKVLGESLFSAKYFYAKLVAFEHPQFICIPIVEPQINSKEMVIKYITGKPNHEIEANTEAMNWLCNNGQDTTIVSYFFNFKNDNGSLNTSLDKMNDFNNAIYEILSIPPGSAIEDISHNPLFVTSSEFDIHTYGVQFIENQMLKAGVKCETKPLSFLISTLMCPWITATSQGNYFEHLMQTIISALEPAKQKLN